ncbi:MAG: hypothetical protein Q9M91_00695 [Candidatus Dojkabacteria bacterium]|nr:hypothetical protein [Candidatus Dojkabacteria bacterium]
MSDYGEDDLNKIEFANKQPQDISEFIENFNQSDVDIQTEIKNILVDFRISDEIKITQLEELQIDEALTQKLKVNTTTKFRIIRQALLSEEEANTCSMLLMGYNSLQKRLETNDFEFVNTPKNYLRRAIKLLRLISKKSEEELDITLLNQELSLLEISKRIISMSIHYNIPLSHVVNGQEISVNRFNRKHFLC